MFLKSVYRKIRILFTEIRSYTFRPSKKGVIYKKIPYYSQWETKDISKILSGEVSAANDPLWKNSGAKTKLEYLNWSWNGCGMACLKMILEYLNSKKVPLVTLGKQSLNYGCYELNKSAFEKGNYENSLPGLFYKPFLTFIKQEYNLKGQILSPMVIADIASNLEKGNIVMASVSGRVRDPKNNKSKKGGHLVVVTGYNFSRRILYIHNPSGTYKRSQKHFPVEFKDFNKFFDNKGIVIYK